MVLILFVSGTENNTSFIYLIYIVYISVWSIYAYGLLDILLFSTYEWSCCQWSGLSPFCVSIWFQELEGISSVWSFIAKWFVKFDFFLSVGISALSWHSTTLLFALQIMMEMVAVGEELMPHRNHTKCTPASRDEPSALYPKRKCECVNCKIGSVNFSSLNLDLVCKLSSRIFNRCLEFGV